VPTAAKCAVKVGVGAGVVDLAVVDGGAVVEELVGLELGVGATGEADVGAEVGPFIAEVFGAEVLGADPAAGKTTELDTGAATELEATLLAIGAGAAGAFAMLPAKAAGRSAVGLCELKIDGTSDANGSHLVSVGLSGAKR
jgi:hypothetical protein